MEIDTKTLAALIAAGNGQAPEEIASVLAGIAAAPEPLALSHSLGLVAKGDGEGPIEEFRAATTSLRTRYLANISDNGAARERLAALRDELARRNLQGFIVPTTDEHFGEYVPLRAQRLNWLTGFSGSAGLAIVLADEAVLFVDGRYTLQVREQVDQALFAAHHITEEPPATWLSDQPLQGRRIGYDPWLLTVDTVGRYQAACEEAGAELVPCDGNPIDAVWSEQPPSPLGPVVRHDLCYAGECSSGKRAGLGDALGKEGVDAAVLVMADSIAWLLNLRGADVEHTPLPLGFAILHSDGGVDLFMDRRKITEDAATHLSNGVKLHEPECLGGALNELGQTGKTVLLPSSSSGAWFFHRLESAGAIIKAGEDPCTLPKARKNKTEQAGTKAGHVRDGAALCQFLAMFDAKAPQGELDEFSAAELLRNFRTQRELFRDLSFSTISGFGPNGAVVHYRVSKETSLPIEPGSLYLVDSGGQYLDSTTDVTRTIAVGEPSAEQKDRFTRVLKGHIALARARFPAGTTGIQLDSLARQFLWQAGLDYDHGTGHGVGSYLGVHEGPQRISKTAGSVPLEPGMILSNEPGYYKAGEYGIRIENLLLVREQESKEKENSNDATTFLYFETLTKAPIDQRLIESSLMTAEDIYWLDAYHRDVRESLLSLVDAATAEWLKQATEPIGQSI